MPRQRLSKEARVRQILEASLPVFLKKGFHKTTMTDIVRASGMSRGGVYHYYQNTSDILFDLMLNLNEYRLNIIGKQVLEVSDLKPINRKEEEDLKFGAVVDGLVDKMLDNSDYGRLYTMFLMEKFRDGQLQKLYAELVDEALSQIRKSFEDIVNFRVSKNRMSFLTEFINGMLIVNHLLGARDVLVEERELMRSIVELIMKPFLK